MTEARIFSMMLSTLAFGMSVISLYRTFVVDSRDRRRSGYLSLNSSAAQVAVPAGGAELLKQRWHGYLAAAGNFHSGFRMKTDDRCDSLAADAMKLLAAGEDLRSKLPDAWSWELETLLVDIDMHAYNARVCREAYDDLEVKLDKLVDQYAARVSPGR